jgi:hypothetical protein
MGSKFAVPCNALEHINAMFGSNNEWLVPKKKNFIMSSIDWNGTKWNKEEVPYAIRRYDPYGKLDVNQTLQLTNELFDDSRLHIKEIPTDNKFDND